MIPFYLIPTLVFAVWVVCGTCIVSAAQVYCYYHGNITLHESVQVIMVAPHHAFLYVENLVRYHVDISLGGCAHASPILPMNTMITNSSNT